MKRYHTAGSTIWKPCYYRESVGHWTHNCNSHKKTPADSNGYAICIDLNTQTCAILRRTSVFKSPPLDGSEPDNDAYVLDGPAVILTVPCHHRQQSIKCLRVAALQNKIHPNQSEIQNCRLSYSIEIWLWTYHVVRRVPMKGRQQKLRQLLGHNLNLLPHSTCVFIE